MIQPKDVKPKFKGRITTVGNGKGFTVPKWFLDQWQIEKGREYEIEIREKDYNTEKDKMTIVSFGHEIIGSDTESVPSFAC